MPLNEDGFALALDQLTDATNGINKVNLGCFVGTPTLTVPGSAQTITFDAAVGAATSGSVDATGTYTFTVPQTYRVEQIWLYQDTTLVATIDVEPVTDTVQFDYVIDSLTINMT